MADDARQAQPQGAAVAGTEESGFLDQIINETRIGKDDWERDQSRRQIATLVDEVMKGTLRVSKDLEATINARIADIDKAMVLGCGHPMGPFTLCDFVGLDTTHRIAEIMYEEYREERYAPPPLLKRIVALGRFGKKSGAGFYDWSAADAPVPLQLA